MKNIPRFFFASLIFCLINACSTAKRLHAIQDKAFLQSSDSIFENSAMQYALLVTAAIRVDKFPKNYDPNKSAYEWSNSSWWCSGFYPGTLLLLHEQTRDGALYDEALRMLSLLEKEKANTRTHDLGFMMYCSFGNALRLTGKADYKDVLLQSAKSLSTRFNPTVGCIKSWDSKPSDFLVIIDNMMNLELLFWATKVSGDSSFYKIAVTHADNTMKNHFRPDGRSYHVINYNPQTGAVQEKKTAQGYSNESAWARGQAWGLYGYTVAYRETGDKKYLAQAQTIADFILNHPALPKDKIPYWDLAAPDIPSALRDASAGAIMCSALLELSRYASAGKAKQYFTAAETMLKSLSSPQYRSAPGANGGFLLQHCVGHKPAGTEVDVSLTYADYYYAEALKRYKEFARRKGK